jgi:hypothetical protein
MTIQAGMKVRYCVQVLRYVSLQSQGKSVMRKLVILLLLAFTLPAFCLKPPAARAHESSGNYLQIVCRQYALDSPEIPSAILKSLRQPASLTFTDSRGTAWQATERGLVETDSTDKAKKVLTGKDGLPILSVTGIAEAQQGKLWLSTSQGAVLFIPSAGPDARSFYFAGPRYLADDNVLQIVAGRNHAWIRTRTGISFIAFEPYTLEQKSGLFIKRIQQRHHRHGYVAGCDLLRAGDPSSFRMTPDDNDGLWTSIYVAAECFRYASTHSTSALANARTSLEAMLRLVSITGIPGYPARSLMHKGDYRDPSGEWHWTADGQWEWKGDTSSDELVGHFFAYWVAYNLLPGEQDRAAIRSAVSSIASGLIEHHMQLIGYGGHVTTWGRYNPEYLKTESRNERALDSAELLSHLRVAYAITGDKKFLDAYQHIGGDLGYVQNIVNIPAAIPDENNFSDEELAILSFYPLVDAEKDPALRGQYQAALTKLWRRVRDEKSPLWNYIYAANTGSKTYDCAASLDTLRRIPLSTIAWTVDNSQRADLVIVKQVGRFGEPQAQASIPPNERRVMKWNDNPFRLDGGDDGRREDDGSFFLLPYWMGRYYHLLSCPQ